MLLIAFLSFFSGPAPDSFTNLAYERTQQINEYKIVEELSKLVNLEDIGEQKFEVFNFNWIFFLIN